MLAHSLPQQCMRTTRLRVCACRRRRARESLSLEACRGSAHTARFWRANHRLMHPPPPRSPLLLVAVYFLLLFLGVLAIMPSKKAKSKQKAKAKKEARKAAVAAENAKRALVSAALLGDDGRPNNVLAAFAPFAKYDRAGLDLTIEFGAPSTIAPDDMDWMLRRTKTNMEELYISGGWGWNDADKRRELTEDDARHLLVRRRSTAGDESKDGSGDATSQGELVAFAHFRFLLEDDAPVLYVQELQLAESVQRKGLGKHLMQVRTAVRAGAGACAHV